MGMYDSIYLTLKCPICESEGEFECQTKDLDCELNVFRKGDDVGTDKHNYVDCISECGSTGRFFYLRAGIEKGIITGNYEIIEA